MSAEANGTNAPGNTIRAVQTERSLEVAEEYEVVPGLAFVRILYDYEKSQYIYFIRELEADLKERRVMAEISAELERMIPLIYDGPDGESYDDVESVIEEYVASRRPDAGEELTRRLKYELKKRSEGFGDLYAMILDGQVEDISCNGPGVPVYVYHKKYGSLKTNIMYLNEAEVSSALVKLAQLCGKEISVSNPILDGITTSGHRIQGMYGKEISPRGSAFTMRLYREKPFTPIDLVRTGTASAEIVTYFWYMVESLTSALIVGPPAVGKTSTLNSVLMLIPPNTKVFSIEETREINIMHPNWVAASTRETGISSYSPTNQGNRIDLFDLVKMAMRQRPTYIVVGEVRGKEAYTLFQAMSTGHTTYSTMHADSMSTLMNRLESEPLNVPRILVSYLRTVVIDHFIRKEQKTLRRITEVNEIVGVDHETNEVVFNRVFSYDSRDDTHHYSGHSEMLSRIARSRNITERDLMLEFEERKGIIKRLSEMEKPGYEEISEAINQYYNSRRGSQD